MNDYLKYFNINEQVYQMTVDAEKKLQPIFQKIDEVEEYHSIKVLASFKKEDISTSDFASTTGYGYGDIGRDKIERVFAQVLGAEAGLVRGQFISGSHALTVALFALLRPNDTLLSITGLPYDTLLEVIGIKDNPSSLKSFNINYEQIDLIDNDFDYEKIEIQRSKGYSERKSISIEKLAKVIKFIKNISQDTIIMVDNCYAEFVEKINPSEVGADICVGSLIKNLGGGIAPNGAYIVGKSDLIKLCAERLNLPGEAEEVGPSLGINKDFLMGLYKAPSVVASALKTSILASFLLENLGYQVDLVNYCRGIQNASAIDSNSVVEPSPMPGYDDEVVMASGSFIQGSSIEISCDGPLREPYLAYEQGGITYTYGKIAVMSAIRKIMENKK